IWNTFRPESSRPLNFTEPRRCTRPMIARRVVERPTPLRPRRLTISPARTSSRTPRRMWLLPYHAFRSRTSSTGFPQGAEVSLLHRGVAADLLRRAARDDLAIHEHRDAIGQIEHHPHVVLDHEQRLAGAHLPDELHRLGGLGAAHAGGRLVEQDDAGAAGDRHADLERALLRVGKRARRHLRAAPQADLVEHFVDPRVYTGEPREPMPERVPVSGA